ncbi:hypothetical protein LTR53_003360 [Teratosphaeriaceae sp. CCFEE 6253]|nr:hypothetical protein LTR53_003360 [Teratosphaeriaceae sp. CCFEE 6253]
MSPDDSATQQGENPFHDHRSMVGAPSVTSSRPAPSSMHTKATLPPGSVGPWNADSQYGGAATSEAWRQGAQMWEDLYPRGGVAGSQSGMSTVAGSQAGRPPRAPQSRATSRVSGSTLDTAGIASTADLGTEAQGRARGESDERYERLKADYRRRMGR